VKNLLQAATELSRITHQTSRRCPKSFTNLETVRQRPS